MGLAIVVAGIRYGAINPVPIRLEVFEPQLKTGDQVNRDAGAQPDRQADDIDDRIELVAKQNPKGSL